MHTGKIAESGKKHLPPKICQNLTFLIQTSLSRLSLVSVWKDNELETEQNMEYSHDLKNKNHLTFWDDQRGFLFSFWLT